MRNFYDLAIWHKSHLLTLRIYSISQSFPREEQYGLVSQIRRACSSIPSNIAEGCGRNSNPDMKRFLTISSGSASELAYHLLLAKDLNYLSENIYKELTDLLIEIRKMIHAFIRRLS